MIYWLLKHGNACGGGDDCETVFFVCLLWTVQGASAQKKRVRGPYSVLLVKNKRRVRVTVTQGDKVRVPRVRNKKGDAARVRGCKNRGGGSLRTRANGAPL